MVAPNLPDARRRWKTLAPGLCVWLAAVDSGPAQDAATSKLAPAEAPPAQEAPAEAEAEPEHNNWIELSAGGVALRGDSAQFMQRHGIPSGEPFGGIEDLQWEQYVGQRGLFEIDGRALVDNNDYLIRLSYEHPDKGYVRFGYREFRTWYDGSGGFFPPNQRWFELYDDELAIDRGEIWFEAGLTLPDTPQVRFRYSHQFREGMKDSTSWGDSTQTITPPLANPNRKIAPGFWDIDEKRDLFEIDLSHRINTTDWGLGIRVELLDQDNTRNERRNPGEANDRSIVQREGVEADLFNVRGFTETPINEKVLLTVGGAVTTLDTDISGSRVYRPAPTSAFDEGFSDLGGGSQLKQYVGNVSLLYTPYKHLAFVPAFRVEHQNQDGFASFTETSSAPPEPLLNERDRSFLDVSETLEVRYTGLRNWVFTARGEWLQGRGDLQETEFESDPATAATILVQRDTDSDRFTQKYSAGANWYPHRRVNLAAQYYHKERDNDYDHLTDSTSNTSGNRYPAFITAQNFKTDDVNFRVTWRPGKAVTLVSRYDFQLSTVDTAAGLLAEVESGNLTSHIFSQSATWVPWTRLYVQGSLSVALNETETPANELTGAAANLVTKSKNNYWTVLALIGFVMDQKTDLEAQYTFYQADNWIDNSLSSQPYGAEGEEHGITIGLIRKIAKNIRWKLLYGFFDYRDVTSGFNNDYEAHLVYSSLQYFF